jgi:APA family basic amino acid/polyamine antiporter
MQEIQDRSRIPLKRVIGLPTAILLVAGIMIGSGVFKKIAPMSQALKSEPYILMVWVVAGVITIFGAFTYAGLASMTKETGGVYEYLRLIYGDLVAYLLGWTYFTIVGTGSIAALAYVFSQSADALFHLPVLAPSMKDISLAHFIYPFRGLSVKLLAISMIILLTWVNIRGVKNAGKLNNIVTAAKILGIFLLIAAGIFYAGKPVAMLQPDSTVSALTGAALFSGFFGALLSALWAYDGWANVTFVTGEIKNPERNLPYAIIGGVGIATLLYVLLNYVYMKVLSVDQLAAIPEHQIAAAVVSETLFGNAGATIIVVLILTCTFGALNGCVIAYPRITFRMAQEKVFFKKVAYVHPVFNTPYMALIYTCVWACVLVFTGTFDEITNLVVFSNYLFFGLAAAGLIKMKLQKKITKKVVGYPVLPVIIIIFSAVLVVNTIIVNTSASLLGLLLMFSGLPFYYWFRKRNNLTPDAPLR